MVLINAVLWLSLLSPDLIAQQDSVAAIRRLAATAQLAAQEYQLGVSDGKVVAEAEVEEAGLFFRESRRTAELLPSSVRSSAAAELDSLIRLVERLAPPDSIAVRVRNLTESLSKRFRIVLDELPAHTPSLARGRQVYQAECTGCHGSIGAGDGPMAAGLDPGPADLTDQVGLAEQSPLDFYRRISIGVAGTAMPGFEGRLPAEERWAVALYATVLRLPPARGNVPAELQSFETTGRMGDDQVLAALGPQGTSAAPLARLAAVRVFGADDEELRQARVLAQVRAQVDSAYALARSGDKAAAGRAVDAYMTFEGVERSVRARDPALAAELEAEFAALRSHAAGPGTGSELEAVRNRLHTLLENAGRSLEEVASPLSLFIQSFVILVREALEAILIIGALTTFLVKMGAPQRRRDVNLGVAAALVASVLTAIAVETIFHLTPAKQEVLEGFTMLAAAAVLFYVSYWMLSKMEVVKWTQFVRSKAHQALSSGSGFALGSAAFLAVYREGFETVLFYKALLASRPPDTGGAPILAGFVLGSVMMIGVYLAVGRFGVRLPLRPFFAATSAFLYYMAFVFAGKGIAELQAGALIPTTMVPGGPRAPLLGIYPTMETLLAQGFLVALLIVGLLWTFAIEPRRRPETAAAG